MKELLLDKINGVAPYGVTSSANSRYSFETRHGIRYLVGFIEDSMCGDDIESYQFFITNESEEKSPNDAYLWMTLFAIIEEFFRVNESVMVYICDREDGKADARARLFERKFVNMHCDVHYVLKVFRTHPEGVPYYGALMFRKDHPMANEISSMADETINWAEETKP